MFYVPNRRNNSMQEYSRLRLPGTYPGNVLQTIALKDSNILVLALFYFGIHYS